VLVTVFVSLALYIIGWSDAPLGLIANAVVLGLLLGGVREGRSPNF
jgi:hypothetical protein